MLRHTMPSLLKFLAAVIILAGAIFAGMYALATFVEPRPRDLSYTVPADKLRKDETR